MTTACTLFSKGSIIIISGIGGEGYVHRIARALTSCCFFIAAIGFNLGTFEYGFREVQKQSSSNLESSVCYSYSIITQFVLLAEAQFPLCLGDGHCLQTGLTLSIARFIAAAWTPLNGHCPVVPKPRNTYRQDGGGKRVPDWHTDFDRKTQGTNLPTRCWLTSTPLLCKPVAAYLSET
jgi:hypothetical protein